MTTKWKAVLMACFIIIAFAAGFAACYFILRPDHELHTYIRQHPNGQTAHRVTYKAMRGEIPLFGPNRKHGTETKYDEDGNILETGEWWNGRPWNGRCFIPAAGDAGSAGGLGQYRTFKNGVQLD
ncbi:MAG TPA: hypothetical protein VEJ63_10000 [Planctomycetota bacterium]|nr:hypothetical protein [Planctomycetota bacterium]